MVSPFMGCAAHPAITTNGSYEPVPAGYAGPVATLADSGVEESPTTAQIFAVVAVDGQAVSNSFFTTAEAKGKPGYDFSRSLVQRATDAQDNRKVLVYISDIGLEMVQRLKVNVDAHHGAVEEAMGPRKVEQLKKLLKQFIDESAAS